jgi:hypothetical protein
MIHLADEETTKNWIKFQRDYFGKRFFYKGWIISKAAAFGLIERGEVQEQDLVKVDSDYHKKIILV